MAIIRLMRWLEAVLAISALAARAAADPIDDRADFRPQVEAGSPATEGRRDAAPSGAGLAPTPDATPRSGSPLWAIPLTALTATRDRPLFSASRRPPVVAAPIAAPPPKQEALAPPPEQQPLPTLIGTIVSREASVAMLRGPNTEAISRLRIGQEDGGWRVRAISLGSIVVEKGEQSVDLGLPRLNGAPRE
jgi:general secretion pathway protein N